MNCARCQAENEAPRRYCHACGASLSAGCPRCAFVNRSSDKFCGGCGDALAQALAVAPRREHMAAPKVAPPASAAKGAALSVDEVAELVKRTSQPRPAAQRRVSQEELDALFGS